MVLVKALEMCLLLKEKLYMDQKYQLRVILYILQLHHLQHQKLNH
jgi:hypothetical protein